MKSYFRNLLASGTAEITVPHAGRYEGFAMNSLYKKLIHALGSANVSEPYGRKIEGTDCTAIIGLIRTITQSNPRPERLLGADKKSGLKFQQLEMDFIAHAIHRREAAGCNLTDADLTFGYVQPPTATVSGISTSRARLYYGNLWIDFDTDGTVYFSPSLCQSIDASIRPFRVHNPRLGNGRKENRQEDNPLENFTPADARKCAANETSRIVLEICELVSREKILDKLFQLEKDMIYYLCRDLYKKRTLSELLNTNEKPEKIALGDSFYCVGFIFPSNDDAKSSLLEILKTEKKYFPLVYAAYSIGLLRYFVEPNQNDLLLELRDKVAESSLATAEAIANLEQKMDANFASLLEKITEMSKK